MREEVDTSGSRSARWKGKGGSSPQQKGTEIGELGVEGKGQSPS